MKLIQMKVKMLPKLLNKPLASKNKKAYQTMSVGEELPVEWMWTFMEIPFHLHQTLPQPHVSISKVSLMTILLIWLQSTRMLIAVKNQVCQLM